MWLLLMLVVAVALPFWWVWLVCGVVAAILLVGIRARQTSLTDTFRQVRAPMLWFMAPAVALASPIWGMWAASSVPAGCLLTLAMWPAVVNERPVSAGRGFVIGGLVAASSSMIPCVGAFVSRSPNEGLGGLIWIFVLPLYLLAALVAGVLAGIAGAIIAARLKEARRLATPIPEGLTPRNGEESG